MYVNLIPLSYNMVVFFWVDVVNGFFPEFLKSFLGQKHWESFWKKIQLILQFFGKNFIKKIYTKKFILIWI